MEKKHPLPILHKDITHSSRTMWCGYLAIGFVAYLCIYTQTYLYLSLFTFEPNNVEIYSHTHSQWWMVKETERARAIHKKAFNALILEKSGHTKNLSTYTQWIYPHYRRCKTWNAYSIENIRKTLWTKCMIRCLTIRLENTSAMLSPWIFIWAVFFLLNNAATELNIFQTITQSTHALCTHSHRTGTITSTNIPHKHMQFNISNHIFPSFSHIAASFSHIFHIIVVSRYTKIIKKNKWK